MTMSLEHGKSRIAVMGGGAVGCYYGGMLARAGADVMLIGRAQHVDVINRDGLDLDTLTFRERVKLRASTEVADVAGAEVVLFCVKSLDTEDAARALLPHLRSDALIVALQNGVDNPERIAAVLKNPLVPAVVYVGAAMAGPGHVRHSGRGDLVIGTMPRLAANPDAVRGLMQGSAHGSEHHSVPDAATVQALAQRLEAAGIGCKVSDNVEGDLWGKLLINCAYNAISALGRSPYARMTARAEIRALMTGSINEVLAVAHASGVRMPPGDWVAIALKLAEVMKETTSSTAQDLARGKKTEIDHLNGFIAQRGAALGVPVPVNQALHALVKLLEETVTSTL